MNIAKKEYSMIFDHYEATGALGQNIHCRNVRIYNGKIIQSHLRLDKEISSKVVGHLTAGEIIVFSANLEFKDIEFQYPHGEKYND